MTKEGAQMYARKDGKSTDDVRKAEKAESHTKSHADSRSLYDDEWINVASSVQLDESDFPDVSRSGLSDMNSDDNFVHVTNTTSGALTPPKSYQENEANIIGEAKMEAREISRKYGLSFGRWREENWDVKFGKYPLRTEVEAFTCDLLRFLRMSTNTEDCELVGHVGRLSIKEEEELYVELASVFNSS